MVRWPSIGESSRRLYLRESAGRLMLTDRHGGHRAWAVMLGLALGASLLVYGLAMWVLLALAVGGAPATGTGSPTAPAQLWILSAAFAGVGLLPAATVLLFLLAFGLHRRFDLVLDLETDQIVATRRQWARTIQHVEARASRCRCRMSTERWERPGHGIGRLEWIIILTAATFSGPVGWVLAFIWWLAGGRPDFSTKNTPVTVTGWGCMLKGGGQPLVMLQTQNEEALRRWVSALPVSARPRDAGSIRLAVNGV